MLDTFRYLLCSKLYAGIIGWCLANSDDWLKWSLDVYLDSELYSLIFSSLLTTFFAYLHTIHIACYSYFASDENHFHKYSLYHKTEDINYCISTLPPLMITSVGKRNCWEVAASYRFKRKISSQFCCGPSKQ